MSAILAHLNRRDRELEGARDKIRAYAEALVAEHRSETDRLEQFIHYSCKVTPSAWGFRLGWYQHTFAYRDRKKTIHSRYVKTNAKGKYTESMLVQASEEEIELFNRYEPRFAEIRMVMKRLGVDRAHAVATRTMLGAIKSLETWDTP